MKMKERTKVSYSLLKEFSEFIAKNLGIQFKDETLRNLENKLYPMAAALGSSCLDECLDKLIHTPLTDDLKAMIAHYITIGETYFFRDADAFHILEKEIFPKLIQERWNQRELRIWSSACCTGEELYSVAILLHQLLPALQEWNIFLIGTDINREFLKRAEKGIFSVWSFRGVSEAINKKYFTKLDSRTFAISSAMRQVVKFYPINLVEETPKRLEPLLNEMDIIFACNVLYYFSPVQVQQVIDNLQSHLAEGGILLVSPVEVPLINHPALKEERHENTTFFRKINPAEVVREPTREKIVKKASPAPFKPKFTPYTLPQPEPILEENELVGIQQLIDKGEIQKAFKACEEAEEKNPLNAKIYYLQATIYQDQGNNAEAIRALEKAIFFDPAFMMAYFVLGNLLVSAGDTVNAKRRLKMADKLLRVMSANNEIYGSDGLRAEDLQLLIAKVLEKL